MNRKITIILIILISVIVAGIPESFARPQYLTNLTAVYGVGSCGTCHVNSGGGQRDFNGTFRQNNSSNGTFEQRDPNRTFAGRGSNGTFRQRNNSSRTLPLNSYGTLFGNQPDHANDASAALMAIGEPPTSVPEVTTVAVTPKAPGFEIVASLAGLFTLALLARRRVK
jgi:PGF-CTERM protein